MTLLQVLPLATAVVISSCSRQQQLEQTNENKPLTVVVIGDGGDPGSAVRANAKYLNDMFSEQHDGGKPDALFFLGDNFYPTGLNVPVDEVESKIKNVLGPYRPVLEGLGKSNVHSIAGNHDYYARNALEKSLLFGLVNIEVGPIGLSERGNEREARIEWWTYYYKMPASVVYPTSRNGGDSVEFVLFDSALPLRTDPSTWSPALDSLRRLLAVSSARPGISWRILMQHHPWHSVGRHGGYSVWDDEEGKVAYLANCDKDSNAVQWFINSLDPQDLCADKYRMMLDSLRSVIANSPMKFQLAMVGHDHSLQLLSYPESDPDCSNCPKVHVISGAGSKTTVVKAPSPPREFTASQIGKEGVSHSGFTQLRFESDRVRIVFFSAGNGEIIDMGGGKKEFLINKTGELIP